MLGAGQTSAGKIRAKREERGEGVKKEGRRGVVVWWCGVVCYGILCCSCCSCVVVHTVQDSK